MLAIAIAGGAVVLLTHSHDTSHGTADAAAVKHLVGGASHPSTASATTPDTVTNVVTATRAAKPKSPLRTFNGGSYTLGYPIGWKRTRTDQDMGSYSESRWVSPDPDVWTLIDYTPGFNGTPEQAAEGVREQVEQSSSYRQLAWRAIETPGGSGWRWRFILSGAHETDTFFAACATGWAVLGRAPLSAWPTNAKLFSQVTNSFRPTC